MKGVIFNLLEAFITDNLGEDGYDNILAQCNLQTEEPFVGPGSYPDKHLVAIAEKTAETMGMPMAEALRSFGQYCMPKLAESFPQFMSSHVHPKSFLQTVDSIHYVEVIKLYENAKPPHFNYEDPSDDRLIIRYLSERKLCHFMEGLIDGVADYYATPVRQQQSKCMHNGDDCCEFDLRFQ